jgi:hypothetical protein
MFAKSVMLKYKYIPLFLTLMLFIFLTSCQKKRTPISYELPKDYSGWVTVKYEKPDAPKLEISDGRYHIKISPDGFAETSSRVEDGWAENEYYWMNGNEKFILPQYTEDKKTMIHAERYGSLGSDKFVKLDTLPLGKEIILVDGSKITKLDDKGGMSFKSGRYFLYMFYVSRKPEDIWDFTNNHLPPIHPSHEKW